MFSMGRNRAPETGAGGASEAAPSPGTDGAPARSRFSVFNIGTQVIALVAGGFGVCVTTASTASLRLPGVVYRPLVSNHLREIELSCLYRQSDESPLLAAFLSVVRDFSEAHGLVKRKS